MPDKTLRATKIKFFAQALFDFHLHRQLMFRFPELFTSYLLNIFKQ